MLLELSIRDFAIIDALRLDAGNGLTVLTGETGAGKSIIIDAMGAILGGRVGSEYIREGATSARIEAIFSVPQTLPPDLAVLLDEYGLEPEDGTIALSRDLARSRGTARANGRAVPVSVLQSLGQHLAAIHGQTDHLALLRASDQLALLDRYAGLQERRVRMSTTIASLRQVRAERVRLSKDERDAVRRLELLRFQIDEIEQAALKPGEDVELEQEQRVLAGAERLQELSAQSLTLLAGDGGDEPSVEDLLARLHSSLVDLARIDPSRQEVETAAATLLEGARDLARDVRRYSELIDHDPARLEAVQERLETIKQLKRKYGTTIEEVLAFWTSASDEAETLVHREEHQADLADREHALVLTAASMAAELHHERVIASQRLARAVECELNDLSMAGARFDVALRQTPDPEGLPCDLAVGTVEPGPYAFGPWGVDRAEFLVAPNVGESLKPAAKIASGGETSRIMLALQSVLSEADQTPTMVFDEVDVGVGGRNGRVLGEKLWQLAARRQVFCITHLPQIAVFGDVHFKIVKEVYEGRTRTTLRQLEPDGRAEEIAQMLGGHRAGQTTAVAARDLLHEADEWKQTMHAPHMIASGE